jgi:hypothetical protein
MLFKEVITDYNEKHRKPINTKFRYVIYLFICSLIKDVFSVTQTI